jgi:hypothetical protein
MSEKFTPGPWRWHCEPQGIDERKWTRCNEGQLLGKDDAEVLWLGDGETYYPSRGEEPTEEDAHLIAAAPDLYEALERVEVYVTDADDLAVVRAALAKARGEQDG